VDYVPYSADHVVGQVQLLFLSALAFTLLMRTGVYPPELRSTNLDSDWFYRRLGRAVVLGTGQGISLLWNSCASALMQYSRSIVGGVQRYHGSGGVLARTWATGSMAFWATFMLAVYLILTYL
jgi:multicomponent Na+:H+ antiporter subunit D